MGREYEALKAMASPTATKRVMPSRAASGLAISRSTSANASGRGESSARRAHGLRLTTMMMLGGDWGEHRDDGYRSLGRYFAEFSELVGIMETAMVGYFQRQGVEHTVAYLPFGVLTADPMTAVFFDMAAKLHDHNDKERRIAKKLRQVVRDEIPFRNDAAHGLWIIGGGRREGEGDPVPVKPTLLRTKPGRGDGALITNTTDLDALADGVRRLQPYLHLYGKACFEQPEDRTIRDFVQLNDQGNLMPGPKAPGLDPLD